MMGLEKGKSYLESKTLELLEALWEKKLFMSTDLEHM